MSLATKRWLRGLSRSWTAHAGTYIAIVGYLQTQDKLIDKYLGADATGILMMLFGLIVVLQVANNGDVGAGVGRP